MNILLISSNTCIEPYPVYPLGMSIAAQALHLAGHQIRQADILVSGMDGLKTILQGESFDLIGVSIRNIDLVDSTASDPGFVNTAKRIVELCRECSHAPVFAGGPGFSLMPESVMDVTGADYGIAGEGECAVVRLADMIASGQLPDTKILRDPCPVQLGALYDNEILKYYCTHTHTISIQTKRGCACRCAYCSYPVLEGHTVRKRSTDDVIDEIERYHAEYPDSVFCFTDSVFNDPAGEYRDFLTKLNDRCRRIPFDCFLTPWNLSCDDMELLCDCGMVMADIGLDAASDETLKGLKKNFSFREAKACVKELLKRKIAVSCSVMFGGPGETYDTIRAGIENLRSLTPARISVFSGIRILPQTELYRIAEQRGEVPAGWNGLEPLYFIENGLDKAQLDRMLSGAFSKDRFIVYPPDRDNAGLRMICETGYLKFRECIHGKSF